MALAAGTNRTYLSRYFNRQNGQTFYDYVNSYRIQYAENLLKSTNFPLPEIAIKSGFNSISTFRRVFFLPLLVALLINIGQMHKLLVFR